MNMRVSRSRWAALVAAALVLAGGAPATGADADEDRPPEFRRGQVVTVAGTGEGGFTGDGGPARDAALGDELRVDVAPDGSVYVADVHNDRIRVVDADGVIETVAQTEKGPPPDDDFDDFHDVDEYYAWVFSPEHALRSVAVGADGRAYAGASGRIFRVGAGQEPEEEIGGAGYRDFWRTEDGGDGGPAIEAGIAEPKDLAVDAEGSVYVADMYHDRVRRIDPNGVITTIAGGGEDTPADAVGGPATDAELDGPCAVAVDSEGNVYFAEFMWSDENTGSRVWRVDPDGTLTAVAGNGERGFDGDGGPAIDAPLGGEFHGVSGLTLDAEDNLYLADSGHGLVRKVDPDGVITTVGQSFGGLHDVAVGPDGNIYVTADRQVLMLAWGEQEPSAEADSNGTGTAPDAWADEEAGTLIPLIGRPGQRGGRDEEDPGPVAAVAEFGYPTGLAVDAVGDVYVAEGAADRRLLRLSQGGEISVVTDELVDGYPIDIPKGMATADEAIYVAADGKILKIYPDGAVVVAAGGGVSVELAEDGQLATTVWLLFPVLATDPGGALYVGTGEAGLVYRLEDDGTFTIVADQAKTTAEQAQRSAGFAVDGDGNIYVAVKDGNRVDRVAPDGSVTIVAGTGEDGELELDATGADLGDGGPATEAVLRGPFDVAVDADGNVYVSTSLGIRRIDREGVISTVLGSAATTAERQVTPSDALLALDRHGNLYVAGTTGNEVTLVVRPAEIPDPFPWELTAWGAASAAILGAVIVVGVVVWRRDSPARRRWFVMKGTGVRSPLGRSS